MYNTYTFQILIYRKRDRNSSVLNFIRYVIHRSRVPIVSIFERYFSQKRKERNRAYYANIFEHKFEFSQQFCRTEFQLLERITRANCIVNHTTRSEFILRKFAKIIFHLLGNHGTSWISGWSVPRIYHWHNVKIFDLLADSRISVVIYLLCIIEQE